MEERLHHPSNLSPPPPPPSSAITTNEDTQHHREDHSRPPSDKPFKVYVIQYPKEQIYRIPPPENAKIVESHKPAQKKNSSWFCAPKLCWTIVALIILASISTGIAVVYKLTLNPTNPEIQIKKLTVGNAPPTYSIELEMSNPNKAGSVELLVGTASLAFKGHVIAKGSSPTVEQDAKGVDLGEVVLKGRKGQMPKEVEKSLGSGGEDDDYDDENMMRSKKEEVLNVVERKKSKKDKGSLAFSLEMQMTLKKKTWLTTKRGLVKVKCDFVASGLGSTGAVRSQKCEYV